MIEPITPSSWMPTSSSRYTTTRCVYYFQPHALELAHALQRNLLVSLGLTDLGFGRASLALARPSWLPAALTEGVFMMIPEQESGLRDPAYSEAYARGVLEGLREFLRERVE